MQYFYSPSVNAIYVDEVHTTMPEDVKPLSVERHSELMQEVSNQRVIVPDENGDPITVPVDNEDYVPNIITLRQVRIALSRRGLLQTINDFVANMEGQLGEEARIEWEYATIVVRDSILVNTIAQALGYDEEAVNNLFIDAFKI